MEMTTFRKTRFVCTIHADSARPARKLVRIRIVKGLYVRGFTEAAAEAGVGQGLTGSRVGHRRCRGGHGSLRR